MDFYLNKYYELREKLDTRIIELSKQHAKQIKCQKGCDSCCESIRVFPIEFFAIKNELKNSIHIPNRWFNRFRKSCQFLQNGTCAMYNSRPIICRTQGLPLLYQSNDGLNYEASVCPLNFKDFNFSDFTVDNSLFMPEFNSKLYLLNKQFVKENNLFKRNSRKRLALYKL